MSIKYVSIIGLALSIAPVFGMKSGSSTPLRITRKVSSALDGLVGLRTPTASKPASPALDEQNIAEQIAALATAQTQGSSTRTNKMRRKPARTAVQIFVNIGHLQIHAPAAPTPEATAPAYGPHPMPTEPIMLDGTEIPEDYEWSTEIEVCNLCNTGYPDYEAVKNHLHKVHGIVIPKY